MLVRRLLLALAGLMLLLVVLAAGVSPRQPAGPAAPGAPEASAAGASQRPLTRTISAGAARGRPVAGHRGRLVQLTVRGDAVDSVQLGDLGVEPIDPASPALFEL